MQEIPMHEDTISSLRYEVDFSSLQEETKGSNKHIAPIVANSPIVIKPVVSYLLGEIDKDAPENLEESKVQEFARSSLVRGKFHRFSNFIK